MSRKLSDFFYNVATIVTVAALVVMSIYALTNGGAAGAMLVFVGVPVFFVTMWFCVWTEPPKKKLELAIYWGYMVFAGAVLALNAWLASLEGTPQVIASVILFAAVMVLGAVAFAPIIKWLYKLFFIKQER